MVSSSGTASYDRRELMKVAGHAPSASLRVIAVENTTLTGRKALYLQVFYTI